MDTELEVNRIGCGNTIPRHRANVQVTEATSLKADCNSFGGKTPYNSGPA